MNCHIKVNELGEPELWIEYTLLNPTEKYALSMAYEKLGLVVDPSTLCYVLMPKDPN